MRKGGMFVLVLFILCQFTIFFLTDKVVFAEDDTYRVKAIFLSQDNDEKLVPDFNGVFKKGEKYRVNYPEIKGYEPSDEKSFSEGISEDNVDLKVYYRRIPKRLEYTVNYLTENPENGSFSIAHTKKGEAYEGDVIEVEDRVFQDQLRRTKQLYFTLSDNLREYNVYYDFVPSNMFTFDTGGGSYIKPIVADAGADISEKVDNLPTPTRAGYVFERWDREIPRTMTAENQIFRAVWARGEADYKIVYWVQSPDGTKYERTGEVINKRGTTESIAEVEYRVPTHFTLGRVDENVPIKGDGTSVVNVYFNRDLLTIRLLNSDGSLYKEIQGLYGSKDEEELSDEVLFDHYLPQGGENAVLKGFVAEYNGSIHRTFDFRSFEDYPENRIIVMKPLFDTSGQVRYINYYIDKPDSEKGYILLNRYIVPKNQGNIYVLPNEKMTPFIYRNEKPDLYDKYFPRYRSGDDINDLSDKPFDTKVPFDYREPMHIKILSNMTNNIEILFFRNRNTLKYVVDGEVLKSDREVAWGDHIDISPLPENRENMKFAGWYRNPDFSDEEGPLTEQTAIMDYRPMTLYGKWVREDVVVTFDERNEKEPTQKSVEYGKSVEMPENPTREGMEFAGWYTEQGAIWDFNLPIKENMTLYAHWKQKLFPAYTIIHKVLSTGEVIREERGEGQVSDYLSKKSLQPFELGNKYYLLGDKIIYFQIKADNEENTHEFLYELIPDKSYAIRYIDYDTGEEIRTPIRGKTTKDDVITLFAAEIDGYKPMDAYLTRELSGEDDTVFNFRYKRSVNDKKDDFRVEKENLKPRETPVSVAKNTPNTSDSSSAFSYVALSLLSFSGIFLLTFIHNRKCKIKR